MPIEAVTDEDAGIGFGQRLVELARHIPRRVRVRAIEQHHELVAAEARHDVGGAQGGAHSAAIFSTWSPELCPGYRSPPEVIQVQRQQRGGPGAALARGQRAGRQFARAGGCSARSGIVVRLPAGLGQHAGRVQQDRPSMAVSL